MSQLKNLNDKSMKLLMEQVQQQFEDEGLDLEMVKDYVDNQNIVDGICKYFGIDELYFEDYSYLCEMFVLNSDIELPFRKPIRLKKIKVIHKEHYTVSGVKYWEQIIDSYTLLDEEDLSVMRDNGMYNWWEGDLIDNDEDYYETNDDDIEDIKWIDV